MKLAYKEIVVLHQWMSEVQKCCGIGHFKKYHTLCLLSKILHKHCFQSFLALTIIPTEKEKQCLQKILEGKQKVLPGFAHFFRPKIQGPFKDFQGPSFEISRTSFLFTSMNLPLEMV